ncbi:hypothetical protein NL493_25520 [Klebsiella pneumoniae]|nr:hypothetical protein [Klebsiella pneumoniae]
MAKMKVERINVTLHPDWVAGLDELCDEVRAASPEYFGRLGRSTVIAALTEVLIENKHQFKADAVSDNASLKEEIKRVLKNAVA